MNSATASAQQRQVFEDKWEGIHNHRKAVRKKARLLKEGKGK